jgi:hypothetical protein
MDADALYLAALYIGFVVPQDGDCVHEPTTVGLLPASFEIDSMCSNARTLGPTALWHLA